MSSVRVVKRRVVGREILPAEDDFLAIEDPLEIVLHYDRPEGRVARQLLVTMRTPGRDVEMIYGFLFTEGIICAAGDIASIDFNTPNASEAPTRADVQLRAGLELSATAFERNFTAHSSCGVCGKSGLQNLTLAKSLILEDTTQIDAEWIHSLPAQMHNEQETFRKTGGLHAAAIFASGGQLLATREDIGRHNALDKAIGAMLQSGHLDKLGHVLCLSGRMSYEVLQKALVARIPVIAGVGAPSSLAVTLANDFNVTLLGFVRNGSYNIYSCPERLR